MSRSWRCPAIAIVVVLALAGSAGAQQPGFRSTRDIQQALRDKGFDVGAVDGLWGARTQSALTAYQLDNKLPTTGVPDPTTLEKLFSGVANIGTQRAVAPSSALPEAAPRAGVAEAKPDQAFGGEPQPATASNVAPAVAAPSVAMENPFAATADAVDAGAVLPTAPPSPTAWPANKPELDLPSVSPRPEQVISTRVPSVPAAYVEGGKQKPGPWMLIAVAGALLALFMLPGRFRRAFSQKAKEAPPSYAPAPLPPASPSFQYSRSARFVAPQPAPPIPQPARWITKGEKVGIGPYLISGGMFYLGSRLPAQSDARANENCLVDPALPLAAWADLTGETVPYWPDYAGLDAASRTAYVQWLAGNRDDPAAYIGYVFLYFYGLERRLLLDDPGEERAVLVDEIERLRRLYGANPSFQRYASELLSACALTQTSAELRELPYESVGIEVPLALRLELGARCSAGRAIEPDLFLSWVMCHPETRVRTPARRALRLLKELFARQMSQEFPQGLLLDTAQATSNISITYVAASRTFEVGLRPAIGDVPDLGDAAEPLAVARRLLDKCTDQLDDYSRELGRSDGLRPTLSAVARLPAALRRREAETLPASPLAALDRLAAETEFVTPAELARLLGIGEDRATSKPQLREMADLLGAFGYGLAPDPDFALRSVKDGSLLVFALPHPEDGVRTAGEAYQLSYIELALGLVVAQSDGKVEDSERANLLSAMTREGLSANEARRLAADLKWLAAHPSTFGDLRKRIKALSPEERARLAEAAVSVAQADGAVELGEVSFLERLFQLAGLDRGVLYSALHIPAAASPALGNDDDLPVVVPPGPDLGTPLPPPPGERRTGMDHRRLDAIRNETTGISGLLHEIFAEEDPVAPSASAEASEGGNLDRRHRALLAQLGARLEWSRDDFHELARTAGVMPGSAIHTLNSWSIDRYDELLIEGDDPIILNLHLLTEDA